MNLQVVRIEDVEPQPWRNGGGSTRELLAWPRRNEWHVRISVADIMRDGPFSVFAGVDRWFAVIGGAGVTLSLPEGPQALSVGSVPRQFQGELAPACTLLGGPTRDINLMTVRQRGIGLMQCAKSSLVFSSSAPFRALFSTDAVILQAENKQTVEVPPFTLVWSEGAHEPWCITSKVESPRAWLMTFAPHKAREDGP